MPLQRRIPKRGFTNIHRVEYQVVNVRDLARMEPGEVTPEGMKAFGLIGTLAHPVKVLGMGEVTGAYQVSAHAFSGTAMEKIQAAGGSATVLSIGGTAGEKASAQVADSPQEPASGGEEKPKAEEPAGDRASDEASSEGA